jgi:hypothetical protein
MPHLTSFPALPSGVNTETVWSIHADCDFITVAQIRQDNRPSFHPVMLASLLIEPINNPFENPALLAFVFLLHVFPSCSSWIGSFLIILINSVLSLITSNPILPLTDLL